MKHIIKKLALLFVPVYLWFAFFVAFEPNNYFGIKKTASSSQPVARVRAYEQSPGTNLIIGDSRLAHFDMDLVDSLTGQSWQNLAFGGASLKECVDLANYVLDSGNQVDRILFELSFYTLNSSYNTDRFSALEATLRNPLAYCLNLEYNVNALTVFMDTVKGTPDTIESGDWTAADYLDDAGNTIPLHKKLYEYPALITTRCQNWTLNETELAAVNPGVIMTAPLYETLTQWVDKHYRDRLSEADLADPQLLLECRTALDELTQILKLGSVYPFQIN